MGYIAKNWRGVKNSILSQKFLDKVRPETTLKNKIDGAGKKMECQILRLEQTHNKLKQNYDYIFKKIEPFAEYGFNKSHAAAYAVIAYQTAFLKTHHPKEFFAASMSTELGNQHKLSEFYEELKRLNIEIQRPCINSCFAEFKSTDQKFYYALGAIKSVGFEAINQIVKERETNGPFKSLDNFINRVDPKNINKLQLEGLVKAGAFDSLENNRKEFHDNIPNIILASKSVFENKINNQINLFDESNQNKKSLIKNNIKKDWPFEERLSKEFEAIGFFISDHPINEYKGVFDIYKIQNFNSFIIFSELEFKFFQFLLSSSIFFILSCLFIESAFIV